MDYNLASKSKKVGVKRDLIISVYAGESGCMQSVLITSKVLLPIHKIYNEKKTNLLLKPETE